MCSSGSILVLKLFTLTIRFTPFAIRAPETIAESNALLTTPKTHELLAIRSQYLQQYFPRTIALLDQKSNEALA